MAASGSFENLFILYMLDLYILKYEESVHFGLAGLYSIKI